MGVLPDGQILNVMMDDGTGGFCDAFPKDVNTMGFDDDVTGQLPSDLQCPKDVLSHY